MNATDILVMPVASYFVNMYFLGCLRIKIYIYTQKDGARTGPRLDIENEVLFNYSL